MSPSVSYLIGILSFFFFSDICETDKTLENTLVAYHPYQSQFWPAVINGTSIHL